MKRILATALALAFSAGIAFAHDFTLGNLEIHHPASKATLPGQPVGGGFLTVTNKGESFKATLNFEKAGKLDVDFKIEAAKPGANHEAHGG